MNRILAVLAALVLAVVAFGQDGGNLSSLRPAYTDTDLAKAQKSASYLKPGQYGRISTIFWEIFWPGDPAAGNYRGVDKMLDICQAGGITPIVLLQPTPYPASPWGSGTDWWLPARTTWDKIDECNAAMIAHIEARYAKAKVKPLYQLWNEPAGRMTNPPIGEKPGGSNATQFGEWTPALHELLYRETLVLKAAKVTSTRIVSPAISCVGENNKREATEWLSSQAWPKQFNWAKSCGWVSLHLRFGASWATDPAQKLKLIQDGFEWNAAYAEWCLGKSAFAGKRVILTETYVTPADCGFLQGVASPSVLDPYRKVCADVVKKRDWTMVVWGLLPDESDAPGNPWLTYGGWGDYMKPTVVVKPPTGSKPPVPVSGAAITKSGGG